MKKNLLLVMGIWFHYIALSQVPFAGGYSPPAYADVDTTFNSYVNNIFGLLEPGRVSTGLLADYAFEFTDPRIYNGASLHDSTLVEQGIFSELNGLPFTQHAISFTMYGIFCFGHCRYSAKSFALS